MREREIFIAALETENPAERAALLDDFCQSDAQLRGRVERLLTEHERQESFILDTPPSDLIAAVDLPLSDHPEAVIGPYKLLQQIGEGGMGVVYMAEQSHPLQRTVALKIIKPGMDTRQVMARFDAERQALAMMDHPNIAKVLDAGATATGKPFFVMELVKGIPITKYCDEKHLPVRDRLTLFEQVCQAVQHAHLKGIIHRDIKPNNVLVAEYDERAVPKVIDFGVAKATAQKLTERTMFTEFGQVVGTVEYMSPEQSKLNQLDIDTRSDIYSLGVLLYELLIGLTPFDGKRLHEAAFDEMLRIIREEEPPKPSTRMSSSDAIQSIAANRNTEPARLSKAVRGELDWIVMKALEKDRDRRYETASGFAADVQRYLNDEPVHACPPSTMYHFRKLARKNKFALLTAAAGLAALLLIVVGLVVSNLMIAAERDQTAQALNEKELALALAEAQAQMTYFKDALQYRNADIRPEDTEMMYRSVTQLLGHAANLPLIPLPPGEVGVRERIGHRQRDLAFMVRLAGRLDFSKDAFESSIRTFEKLRQQVPSRVDYWHFVADSHRELGRIAMDRKKFGEAEKEFRLAIELHEQRPKRLPVTKKFLPEEAEAYYDLARLLIRTGREDEAIPLVARGAEVNPVSDGQTGTLLAQLEFANLLREAGELEQALALYTEVIDLAALAAPELKCRLAAGCSHLARLFRDKSRLKQAERMYRQAISLREPLGSESPANVRLAQSFDFNELAFVLLPLKRSSEAERAIDSALDLKRALVREFPDNRDYQVHFAHSYLGIGHIAAESGRTSDAEQAYGEAARILNRLVAETGGTQQFEEFLRDTLDQLGHAWQRVNRPDDARQSRQQAQARIAMLASEFSDNPDYQLILARSLLEGGDLDAAFSQCAKIIATEHNLPEAWSIRGDCFNRKGESNEAIEAFTTSIKLQADYREAWTGRAWTYFCLHRWDNAIADYSKAIQLAPEVHTNWYHRGLAHLELAQWDKAAADFTKIVDGWPDEPGGWYLRALAYAQLSQPEKAISDLRQALAKGFDELERLKNEPKLAPLRSHANFKKLLAEFEGDGH